jgi:hypothetical protein
MTRVISKTAIGSFNNFAMADTACVKSLGKGESRKGDRRPYAGLLETSDDETVIRFLPLPASERKGKEYMDLEYWIKRQDGA